MLWCDNFVKIIDDVFGRGLGGVDDFGGLVYVVGGFWFWFGVGIGYFIG